MRILASHIGALGGAGFADEIALRICLTIGLDDILELPNVSQIDAMVDL